MTDPNNLTPPPELVRQIRSDAQSKCDGHLDYERRMIYSAFRAGADQELEACCHWLASCGCPSYGRELRAARRSKQLSLKEQALTMLDNEIGLNVEDVALLRSALELVPEGPAVTPAADARGPGSVADIVNATDEELSDLYEDAGGVMSVAFRAIYNLGREHGAAAHAREQEIVRTGQWFKDRASGREPAAAPDRPLWKAMHAAYDHLLNRDQGELESGHFYAAELCVVAAKINEVFEDWHTVEDVTNWLRAEAERAEAS